MHTETKPSKRGIYVKCDVKIAIANRFSRSFIKYDSTSHKLVVIFVEINEWISKYVDYYRMEIMKPKNSIFIFDEYPCSRQWYIWK